MAPEGIKMEKKLHEGLVPECVICIPEGTN